jgi:tetratricopeptide (TPR) repeat protein
MSAPQCPSGFRSLWFSLILMIVMMIQPVFSASQSLCDRLLHEGDSLYNAFDNRAAFGRYSKAYNACPGDYDGLMKMTRALIDLGSDIKPGDAMKLYRKGYHYADSLQKYFPDSAQSYFLKSLAAANITRLEKGPQRVKLARVIEYNVKKSINIDASFAPAWVLQGGYYREVASAPMVLKAFARIFLGGIPNGTLDDAERALRKALNISPINIYAHLELARTVAAKGDKVQAIHILEKIPQLPRTWHADNRLKQEGLQLLKKIRK